MRRLAVGLSAVATLVVLAVTVFPTRGLLDQRRQIRDSQATLRSLRSETSSLERRVTRLQEDSEIERLAREQYNLVFPGEEAYALLPSSSDDPSRPER